MAFFSLRDSSTSRTVEGPLLQRTWRISSSDAVGLRGWCFIAKPYYEAIRRVNEELRSELDSRSHAASRKRNRVNQEKVAENRRFLFRDNDWNKWCPGTSPKCPAKPLIQTILLLPLSEIPTKRPS